MYYNEYKISFVTKNGEQHVKDTTENSTNYLQGLVCTIAAAVFNCFANQIFHLLPTAAATYLNSGITVSSSSPLLALSLGAATYLISRLVLSCLQNKKYSMLRRELTDFLVTSAASAALNILATLIFAETQIIFVPTLIAGATVGASIYLINKIAIFIMNSCVPKKEIVEQKNLEEKKKIEKKIEKIEDLEKQKQIEDQKKLEEQKKLLELEEQKKIEELEENKNIEINEKIKHLPEEKNTIKNEVIKKNISKPKSSFRVGTLEEVYKLITKAFHITETYFISEIKYRLNLKKESGFYQSTENIVLLEKKEDKYILRMFQVDKELGQGKYGTVNKVVEYFEWENNIILIGKEGRKYALKTPFLPSHFLSFAELENISQKTTNTNIWYKWLESQETIKNEMKTAVILRDGDYQKYTEDPVYRKEIRKIKLIGIQEMPHHVHCGTGEALLMPLCDGNLLNYAENEPLELPHFSSMIWQLLVGLAHIHNRKMIHGDIGWRSPMNILYRKDQDTKDQEKFLFFLADFGFSERTESEIDFKCEVKGLGVKLFNYLYFTKIMPTNEELSHNISYIEDLNKMIKFFKSDDKYEPYSIIINFINKMLEGNFKDGAACLEEWNLIKEKL